MDSLTRDDEPPSALEELLHGLHSAGEFDSSGQFGLDIRKAVEKLASLFPREGFDFLHYWVRFAVFYQAPEIVMGQTEREVWLEFSGHGPHPNEVRSLFTQASRGLRYLQLGVVGALQQGYTRVELQTPSGSFFFGAQEEGLDSTRAFACVRLLASRKSPGRNLPAHPFPANDFPYLEIPVRGLKVCFEWGTAIGGVLLTTASALAELCKGSWRVVALPGHEGFLSVFLPLPGGEIDPCMDTIPPTPANLYLRVDGALFERPAPTCLPPGALVILDVPALKLDLSLRKPVDTPLDLEALTVRLAPVVKNLAAYFVEGHANEINLKVADWLVDQLLFSGDIDTASRVLQHLSPRLTIPLPTPFHAALLERASVLRDQPTRSQQAWLTLELALRCLESEKPIPAEVTRAQEIVTYWQALCLVGAVRHPPLPWLADCVARLHVVLGLRCYRHFVRLTCGVEGMEDELGQFLLKHKSDSLTRNYLLAHYFLSLPPARTPTSEAAYCGALLLAAVTGLEQVPDFPDLPSALPAEDKRAIVSLVSQMCAHVGSLGQVARQALQIAAAL